MLFRVIRVHDWSTYDGWAWLDGYELNNSGDAVDRRSIFVQVGGLQRAHVTLPTRLGNARPSIRPAVGQANRPAAVSTPIGGSRARVAVTSGARQT